MFRTIFALASAAVLAVPLAADVLPFDTVARRLYLLRVQPASGIDYEFRSDRALWLYDDTEKRFERIAPFAYDTQRVYLNAFEDRLIAQGSDHFEFDIASGRFLRRYESIRDSKGWAFSGAVVTDSIASRLGIEPGTYGFFRCPPSRGVTGFGCWGQSPGGDESFSSAMDDSLLRRLYRRPLDPRRSEFTLLGEFSVDPTAPRVRQRFLTVDPAEGHFLVWSTKQPAVGPSPTLHDLSLMKPQPDGSLVETLLRREEDPHNREYRLSTDFAFVPRTRTAFHLMHRVEPAWAYLLTKRPLDSMVEEPVDVLERTAYVPNQVMVNDSITGLPGTLPDRYEQLIPIVGDAPGANGTHWRSDLWLFNPSDEPSSIELRRVSRPEMKTTITLPAHGSVAMTNVLRQLGGGPAANGGDGVALDAIVLTAPYRWGAQVSAYSRAYTHSTTPGEEGGTFGQAVPAVPTRIGYSNHTSSMYSPIDSPYSTPSYLILDRENAGQFRHNLGVVNDSDEPMTVQLYSDKGPSFTVAPHSVANVNLETLFPQKIERIYIAADRPAAIWLSMIDNRTGDATFVPFTLFGIRALPDSYTAVPGVARTRGANGTWWWTDLYGEFRSVDLGEVWHSPRARLHARGCSSEPTQLVGGGHFFRDVVRLAGCDEVDRLGALELRMSSWTTGFTRTYTTRADGGTYGEMLPFYPYRGWPIQHFAGVQLSEKFRVNVGLYNGLDRPVTYTLRLYDQKGDIAREATATLASLESRQSSLQAWFDAPIEPGLYGLTVVPHDEPGSQGRSWAYVSIVDNVTNDPTNWW